MRYQVQPPNTRSSACCASSRKSTPARSMYSCVVAKLEWPARAFSEIGPLPATAAFVIAVCRQSWNGRTRFSIPARASAFLSVTAVDKLEAVSEEEQRRLTQQAHRNSDLQLRRQWGEAHDRSRGRSTASPPSHLRRSRARSAPSAAPRTSSDASWPDHLTRKGSDEKVGQSLSRVRVPVANRCQGKEKA
jgi:hypothetical protein